MIFMLGQNYLSIINCLWYTRNIYQEMLMTRPETHQLLGCLNHSSTRLVSLFLELISDTQLRFIQKSHHFIYNKVENEISVSFYLLANIFALISTHNQHYFGSLRSLSSINFIDSMFLQIFHLFKLLRIVLLMTSQIQSND